MSTYSVFAARRAYDFLCLDIAEPNLNVNVVGGLPGLTTGYGPSHQATEDIAIFRGMPNLTIVDPCDSVDIEQAVPQLAAAEGPSYLRLLRGNVPTVLDEYDYTFELGKAKVLRGGNDVVFISSGLMTMRALAAAKALEAHNVDVAVVHTPTIKPFDATTVLRELNTDRLAVTLENHTIIGGLFETVASAAVLAGVHKKILPVALPDAVPRRRRPAHPAPAVRARRRQHRHQGARRTEVTPAAVHAMLRPEHTLFGPEHRAPGGDPLRTRIAPASARALTTALAGFTTEARKGLDDHHRPSTRTAGRRRLGLATVRRLPRHGRRDLLPPRR